MILNTWATALLWPVSVLIPTDVDLTFALFLLVTPISHVPLCPSTTRLLAESCTHAMLTSNQIRLLLFRNVQISYGLAFIMLSWTYAELADLRSPGKPSALFPRTQPQGHLLRKPPPTSTGSLSGTGGSFAAPSCLEYVPVVALNTKDCKVLCFFVVLPLDEKPVSAANPYRNTWTE